MAVFLVGLASAIEPAGNWGFGPCAVVHGAQNGSRINQCYAPINADEKIQGRYCDERGNFISNCSEDLCPCIQGYVCNSVTKTCDICERGQACFVTNEDKIMTSAADFLAFLPSFFPLLIVLGIGMMVFLLLEMLRHIDEYGK